MTDGSHEGYSTRFGGNVWRVEPNSYGGQNRVSIWPFYAAHDGSMKPGRGGLMIPLDEVEPLVAAILEAAKRLA